MNIESIDWSVAEGSLWQNGFASLGKILNDRECDELTALYPDDKRFRSRINMERYRFGRGEYKYLSYPLPDLITTLRTGLYAALAPIADRWMAALKFPADFPEKHEAFLDICRTKGQTRPTPLILKYCHGDFNCLHQDIYGEVVFPFQVIFSLSEPGKDFTGGELLLVEQRPRAQSIGHVLIPTKGEAIVITTRWRPAMGARGYYRTVIKHGVSTVSTGLRFTLGVVFHDAA
jgi:uncharacterized protein